MTWFKVDDDLAFHQKTVKAGNAAMGLWVRAGAWCAQQLTDGFIPDDMIELIGTPSQRKKLIAARLWIEVDGGCQFHEWTGPGRQPTRSKVLESRSTAAKRQQRYRDGFSVPSQVTHGRNGVTDASVTQEVTQGVTPPPTRPVVRTKELLADTSTDSTQTEIDIEVPAAPTSTITAEVSEDPFDRFWAAYPRKVKKEAARKAWRTVVRSRRVDPEHVISSVQAHAAGWRDTGRDVQYVPHPATWLNSGAYDDPPERAGLRAVPDAADPETELARLRERGLATTAARLIGRPYVEPPQPLSDDSDPYLWSRLRAREWIDTHEQQIRLALTKRGTA